MATSFSSQSSISSSLTNSLGTPEYGFNNVEIYKDSPIGSGAYGIVYRAKADRLNCAAKTLHPTFLSPGSWAVDKFMQECSFLASLHHPHIVQFLGLHSDPSSGQIALLLELMHQNLTTLLHSHSSSFLSFQLIVDISYDVSLAILYLHSNGIIHRDLSSNNVLLTKGGGASQPRAKISDFGMSKLQPHASPLSSLTQVPGCPVYMPPEAWLTPPIYTEKLDVFSLGVLILQMSTCRDPNPGVLEVLVEDERYPTGFLKLPVSELDRRKDDIDIIPSDHYPLKSLILECLNDKTKDRPSSGDMCMKLEALKTSTFYIEEERKIREGEREGEGEGREGEERVREGAISLLNTELVQKLTKTELELKETKDLVSRFESEIETLKQQLIDKDKTIVELKEQQKEQHKDDKTYPDNYSLSSLSPETLQIISSNRQSRVFNLAYKINEGRVIFHNTSSTESIDHVSRIFLQVYQHFFNSGQIQVSFIPLTPSFPLSLINFLLRTLALQLEGSHYDYIEIPNVVKIVSKNTTLHEKNVKLLTDILNLKKDLGEGRSLSLVKGNIVEQDVNIIVSSANCSLQHAHGVSAAINVASHFEVQRHCDEYTSKCGSLDIGQVCHTLGGGSLKCSWIIHAIGPPGMIVRKGETNNEVVREMKQLTYKILQKAEKLDARSIAIPAISSGSLSMSGSLSAKGILEGITSHRFSSPALVDVRVVVLKEDIFSAFVEELISIYNKQFLPSSSSSVKKSKVPQKPVLDLTKYSLSSSSTSLSDSGSSSCKHQ